MIIGSLSPARRDISRQVLTPPMRGMIRSDITTSGLLSMYAFTPSTPSLAVTAEKPADRVIGEAEPDEPPDDAEEITHVDADVVLVRPQQVVVTDRHLSADPRPEEPAADPECQAGQHVEADQAPPEWSMGCDRCHAHAVTSSPSPLA